MKPPLPNLPQESSSEDFFEKLFQRRAGSIKPGLDRIEKVANELGLLPRRRPSILVAGTNGKGSTSAYLYKLFTASGAKVGLYTSPHLISVAERVHISGESIDELKIIAAFNHLNLKKYDELSFFEILTLIGFYLFDDTSVDLEILEVGLGGRLDATNIVSPDVTVITSIGLDHQEYLGPTTQSIAREKCGILRSKKPLFFGGTHSADSNACAEIRKQAQNKNAPIFELDKTIKLSENLTQIEILFDFLQIFRSDLPKSIESSALFLKRNFALAAGIFYFLTGSKQSIENAFEKFDQISNPPNIWGRFDEKTWIDNKNNQYRHVIFDVGHNIEGVKALINSFKLKYPNRRAVGIISILRDKDVSGIIELLEGILEEIVFYQIPHERSLTASDLRPTLHSKLYASFDEAWHHTVATKVDTTILICGSVIGVGVAYQYLCPTSLIR